MQPTTDIPNKEAQKRQVARIVKLSDLTSGEYVQQSGWLPNFVRTKGGVEASRVNIMGILTEISSVDIAPFIAVDQFSATIDDGSAKMQLRSFEAITFAHPLHVGMPVLVIARPKKYSGELFLVPEIIRALPDKKWLDVRKQLLAASELYHEKKESVSLNKKDTALEPTVAQERVAVKKKELTIADKDDDDEVLDGVAPESLSEKPAENVLDMINRLDEGEGVLVEQVIAELKSVRPELDGQQRILSLLLSGDVFEIRPGRIKVLK